MDYSYIIIPIIVLITSQIIKLSTDNIKGNFDIKHVFLSYGGMPSSHTAFATSITTLMALRFGLDAPVTAIALVFTLLIARDAVSFRTMLGNQGRILNKLMAKMSKTDTSGIPEFREKMGHSVKEVLAGAGLGILLTYLLNLL